MSNFVNLLVVTLFITLICTTMARELTCQEDETSEQKDLIPYFPDNQGGLTPDVAGTVGGANVGDNWGADGSPYFGGGVAGGASGEISGSLGGIGVGIGGTVGGSAGGGIGRSQRGVGVGVGVGGSVGGGVGGWVSGGAP